MVTRRQSWLFCRPLPRNVSQVENQAAKTELLKLKYYSASCRLRDSQGSRNSDKLPARRGGDAFSIIPPCTMKYVVKATCRIKRHSKTKASQILWLIIPQSACRVDLPGSQILNLCNSCVSAIFIYSPPPFSSMSFIIFEMQDYRSTINMFGGGGGVLFVLFFFWSNELSKSWVLRRSHGLSSVESPLETNHQLCRTTSCEVVGNTLGIFLFIYFGF